MVRFPSKTNALQNLRSAGVEIGTVIDVGVHEQTPELRAAFPDARHILFEPADDFFPAIRRNYAGLDYVLAPVAVAETDGEGHLHKRRIDGGEVSHSCLVDPAAVDESTVVPTRRLDSFMAERDDPRPYLLKIDVDGFESVIIRSAAGMWADVDVVIVEVTRDTLAERLGLLVAQGFTIYDIVDSCYYANLFHQADLVMVSPRVMGNPHMRALEDRPFTWSDWIPIASFESAVQAAAEIAAAA